MTNLVSSPQQRVSAGYHPFPLRFRHPLAQFTPLNPLKNKFSETGPVHRIRRFFFRGREVATALMLT